MPRRRDAFGGGRTDRGLLMARFEESVSMKHGWVAFCDIGGFLNRSDACRLSQRSD